MEGLRVQVDRLVYSRPSSGLEGPAAHAFIYFLTVFNDSSTEVTLKGRKWVLRLDDGTTQVIEGSGIVGQTPTLAPGRHFSYNSYHLTTGNATARGAFHGVDSSGQSVHVAIPPFEMIVPDGAGEGAE